AQPQAPAAPSATPPAADGKGAQAQAPEQAPQNDSPRTPIKLDIDSLNVNNARVTYTDEASGKQYNVEGIELSTGAIREGSSIPLKLNAYLGTNQPVVRVKTELTGNLRFDTALRRYQLEDARLSGEASGEPLQGKTATFSAQGQLLLDQSAQIAEWNGLKLSVNQLRALGELKARELDKDTKFSGGLSIAPMNLREFLAGIGVTLPAMADANTLG
ncbi:AsmA family protein, partial [Pseudomonas aeruginosa]